MLVLGRKEEGGGELGKRGERKYKKPTSERWNGQNIKTVTFH